MKVTMDVQRQSDKSALYKRAFDQYDEFQQTGFIVPNSMPILYFGDLVSYETSKRKIVTVGLNPSPLEFKVERFGGRIDVDREPHDVEARLSAYFKTRPYSGWFDRSYETLLQRLDASFYGNEHPGKAPDWWKPQPNRALHTDLGSPLATNPTWSKPGLTIRSQLQAKGYPLWRDLMKSLAPHLILASVAKANLNLMQGVQWRSFSPFPGSSPKQEMKIGTLGESKVIWAEAGRTPLFHLKPSQRLDAAKAILEEAGLPR